MITLRRCSLGSSVEPDTTPAGISDPFGPTRRFSICNPLKLCPHSNLGIFRIIADLTFFKRGKGGVSERTLCPSQPFLYCVRVLIQCVERLRIAEHSKMKFTSSAHHYRWDFAPFSFCDHNVGASSIDLEFR